MRALVFGITVFAVLPLGAAHAQETGGWRPYVAVSVGGEYGFPDGFGLPEFADDTIEGALALGAERGDWTVQASFIDTDNDEGYSAGAGYEAGENCPLFGADRIGCSIGAEWRDVGDEQTVTYNAGLAVSLWEREPFALGVAFGGEAITGDVSETSASALLELTWDKPAGIDGLEFAARGGVTHGFEADDTDPAWGAAIGYEWGGPDNDRFTLEAEYESVRTFDEDINEFVVERQLSASFTYRFN